MFCRAIASGRITADTTVVAATGGAVAVAGAHFARLLDLSFRAVVPAKTPADTLVRIKREGGHFLDHFTDW
ncbi:hypothetical protein SBI_02495 [Streptomyces bingchenggensis BCW-1]|uniref:Uncharacterized protein n=2 Tax=Streptomyces TaxID=1883 RepID=D7BYQ7_STRBB|nr:hypothetical protein SBI_02495 [Streptomyces bingchenggensis BCW-1]